MSALKLETDKLRYHQVMDFVERQIQTGTYMPRQKLPSLKKLSEDWGVNFMTISRAFQELAAKGVLEVKHGSGTFVSEQATSLRKKTTKIGLLMGAHALKMGAQHPAVGAYLIGANQRCKPPEYTVQPIFYDYPLTDSVGPMVLKDDFAALAIMEGRLDARDYAFLREHQIPAVSYSNEPCGDGWTVTITNDEPAAVTLLVEHLRALGHQRIGFIFHRQREGNPVCRQFARLAFDHQIGDPNELMILIQQTGHENHWEDVEKFFSLQPLPTAVIVWDEFIIDILLNGCQRRGIRVPEELSVVSVHDSRPLGHRIPITTTLTDESLVRTAYTALDLLARRMSGEAIGETLVRVPPQLIVKASSGPASSSFFGKKEGL